MKDLTFMRGVVIAFLLSLAGAAVFAALTPVLADGLVIRGVISLISLVYILILLGASGIRFGRITTAAATGLLTAVTFYLWPPLVIFALIHIGFIWLARCFYYHNSFITAMADLGLCLLGFAAAVWATEQSHSLFLALWCFLLVQAAILPALASSRWFQGLQLRGDNPAPDHNERFQRALRSAEAALRKSSATH